eukprot:Lithocolla_globosa_v1_NODE_5955_length_1158_cov_52.405258.p2 type:complete len:110 gc:universal NODE_5955_length_1158_cov_52.405258:735-1064(+)
MFFFLSCQNFGRKKLEILTVKHFCEEVESVFTFGKREANQTLPPWKRVEKGCLLSVSDAFGNVVLPQHLFGLQIKQTENVRASQVVGHQRHVSHKRCVLPFGRIRLGLV